MKSIKTSTATIGAILLASVAVIAMPMTAEAFGPGGGGFHGGGGGFHGGGGGFHGFGGGGGFHGFGGGGGFHGFGGGGFRGIGGGGFHGIGGRGIGGGNFHGIGGRGIGGGNFHGIGGRGIAGGNFHGIGGHIAGGNFHGVGGHGIAGGNFHGIAGNGIGGGGRFGNRGFGRGNGFAATRMTQGFGHNRFGHDGFGRNGDWHNGFWHNRGFGGDYWRYGGFGWVGPVFWPYAYSDFSCGIFWGFGGYGCGYDPYWGVAFGDPFWGYGYNDIYDGMFSPFAFSDLAPYLPDGPAPVRQARSRRTPTPTNAMAQMCGDDTKDVADWPINRIQQLVSPDDQQRMKLDDLAQASMKAAQIIKSGCPTSVAFTPTGRLAAMEQRLETMQEAVGTIRGPLDAFYDSLTDEQKAKFNATDQQQPAGPQNGRSRGPAPATVQSCSAANSATQWPAERIEAALRPNQEQEAKLKALQNAASEAAQEIASSCPSEMPITPPARLAAISKRLDVMLTAVKGVRGPLESLYGDLSDEQKAQFNQIGQTHTAQR